MKDRFKVRAWDNEKKEFRKTYPSYIYSQCITNPRRYIVEQCTGLKDKNGKLIYEGDIFEADVLNSFDGDELIGKRIRGQVAYYIDGTCFTFAHYAPFELGQIEVIGNTHENPDLLENKNEYI